MALGTPLYMAPELTRNDTYSIEVDIWALGVMVHNILVGKAPFVGRSKFELFQKVCNQDFDLSAFSKFKNEGIDVKDFLQKCLAKDPEKRATASELLSHPWITNHIGNQAVVDEK